MAGVTRVRLHAAARLAVLAIMLGVAALASAPVAVASTSVSGTISTNTTWTASGSPYILSGTVIVASGVTLTINQGVYVKFQSASAGLTVQGALDVNGTSGSPVVFTSLKDDSDGVDSGGDGSTTPQPGDWSAMSLPGSAASTFDFAQIRYGGGSGTSRSSGMIGITGGPTTFTDSVIEKSSVSGITVSGGTTGSAGSLTLTRTRVSDNGRTAAGAAHGDGINVTNADLTMTDSAAWRNAEFGIEFGYASGYAAAPSSVTGSSIWMNGTKTGTSSTAGISMQTSGLPIGKAPDGSGNNIYDNGNFLPTENWNQLTETHSVGSAYRSDADWSGNFWASYSIVECPHTGSSGNINKHLNYGALEPSTGAPVFARGPISTETDFGASPVCLHDSVTGNPVASSQLDLFFDTPPPVHGGLPLEQSYGCLECALAKYILAHSQAGSPAQPAGDVPSAIQYTGEPVNVSTGTLTESFTDISLPGPGIPFQLVRSYNSRDTTSGTMGTGWTNGLVASLSIDGAGNVTYRSGDGQQVKFTKNGTNYIGRTDLVLNKPTGTTYTITTPDLRVLTFDTSGNLTQEKSRFGPAMSFAYTGGQLTGVTDSAGRSITLAYTSGKLTSVTLPDSRHVNYSYTSGRLTGVTDLRGEELDAGLRRQRLPGVDPGSARPLPAARDLRQPGARAHSEGRRGERDGLRLLHRRRVRRDDGVPAEPGRLRLQVDQEPPALRDRPAEPDDDVCIRHPVPAGGDDRSAREHDHLRVRHAREPGEGDAPGADLFQPLVDLQLHQRRPDSDGLARSHDDERLRAELDV